MSNRQTYVYFIAPVGGGRIKIGCSYHPGERLKQLVIWSPEPLEVLAQAPGTIQDEIHIQCLFRENWSHCEWFNPSPEIWKLIGEIREVGALPAYAISDGLAKRFRVMPQKSHKRRPWTPEQKAEHAKAVKAGWERRIRAEPKREEIAAFQKLTGLTDHDLMKFFGNDYHLRWIRSGIDTHAWEKLQKFMREYQVPPDKPEAEAA